MRILNIEPKDIHVTLDLSITEIRLILKALDKAKIVFDSKADPDMIEADRFLKLFFKLLSEVDEDIGPSKREPA